MPDGRLRGRAVPAAAAGDRGGSPGPASTAGGTGACASGTSLTYIAGALFVAGQVYEYASLVEDGLTISANAYGSVFYLTTGFHGLHVTGGLIAFLLIIGRSFAAKRFGHAEATSAIVTSYYWHFVDVVWIGLFFVIYVLK